MEIRTIEPSPGDGPQRLSSRERASANIQPVTTNKRTEGPEATSEPVRPAQTQRRAGLAQAVSKGFADAGLPTLGQTPTSVEPARDIPASKSAEQEKQQMEALQAFMHSLVQAATAEQSPRNASSTTPFAGSVSEPAQPPGANSAGASYTGLVSRLEDLARSLENPAPSSQDGAEMAALKTAFGDVLDVAGERNPGGSAERPPLSDVIRTIARNLQSTGNPYLATTGNVINTAA